MLAVPTSPEGRPIAEPTAPAPTAPTRPLSRNVTPQLSAEELAAARKASYMRLFDTWNEISHKYGMIGPEEDDEVDIITGEITCDRGRLRELQPRAFAEGILDDDDEGLEEEDEDGLGDESDTSMLPQDEEATPEPETLNGVEHDHPLLQEQPWTVEDDRDLEEFLKVERMRRFAAGEVLEEEETVPPEITEDMLANMNMGAGQMDVIAMFVRREVERVLGGGTARPSPPFPHAAARASTARSASARPANNTHLQSRAAARASSVAAKPPAIMKHRQAERSASLPRTPITSSSIHKSTSLPSIPSALRNGSTLRPSRLSLSASKVRFADETENINPNAQDSPLSRSTAKGKGRMVGERPHEDALSGRRSDPPRPSGLRLEITRDGPLHDAERDADRQSYSPSPISPVDGQKRRKRRHSEESESDANGERSRYAPPSVYLKSLSYHEGKLRECRQCLEAGNPRSRYAALCRGRIDDLMCRFPQMTEEEVDAAIAYREEEEASFEASQTPEARSQKRTKVAPRTSDVVTEIPTSWRPRPGDERYSMAPHRVRGGAFKRCKLCVIAGGVREKRSMFCMGRSGHGKCAFEFEDPSGSSGDENETPEQAAIKQMEHRLLRAQNARMSNMSRALKKEEVPAAPKRRKSTTPYVSYRQQSTRPGLPATRGPSKLPEGEELNPRAPNGRLKPRCGPCLRAGGERAERAFLCPGSGRPKYCEYAPGADSPAPVSTPSGEDPEEEKEPLTEMDAAAALPVDGEDISFETPAKPSARSLAKEPPATGQKPILASAKKSTPGSAKVRRRPKKRPRNSRLGREESSAEDYETEESELELELADSDDDHEASTSASEDERHHRYNRESTGYTIHDSDGDTHEGPNTSLDIADATNTSFDEVDAAGAAADDEDDGDQGEDDDGFVGEVTDEPIDPQILSNVTAGMSSFVPRPNTNKYAPYLSFGGDGSWATCARCEEAGGTRAECAMWCYGREGEELCRLAPGWVPPDEASVDEAPQRRASRAISTERVFSPEHSPDPLASDIEMDDVSPIGEVEDEEAGFEDDYDADQGDAAEFEGDDDNADHEDRYEDADEDAHQAEDLAGRDQNGIGHLNGASASLSRRPASAHSTLRSTVRRTEQEAPTERFQNGHSPKPLPRIKLTFKRPPQVHTHAQYRDPAALVASSDPAPSSSPRSAASYASPLPRAADTLQAALARSIRRDYLAPESPRRTQQT